jgi:hypothetical protein
MSQNQGRFPGLYGSKSIGVGKGHPASFTRITVLRHFQIQKTGSTALSQKQRIFPRNTLECIWEQVPWLVNFRRRFNRFPFGNFLKHLSLLLSEISEKSREEKKKSYQQDSIRCPPDFQGNTITFTLWLLRENGIFFTSQL